MSMFPGNMCNEEIKPNDAEITDQIVQSQKSRIYAAEKLVPFFELSVTLKIFGHVIFEWHFPPTKNK